MQITDDMVDTAMKTAINAGLLPRDAIVNDVMNRRALIRQILESALQAASVKFDQQPGQLAANEAGRLFESVTSSAIQTNP